MNKKNQGAIPKLIHLLKNKNFLELEKLILSLKVKEQEAPSILNLLGVAKIKNNNSSVDEILNIFERAFKKDNNEIDALYNLCSFSLKTLRFNNSIIILLNKIRRFMCYYIIYKYK